MSDSGRGIVEGSGFRKSLITVQNTVMGKKHKLLCE